MRYEIHVSFCDADGAGAVMDSVIGFAESKAAFIGHIQGFTFNNIPYLQQAKNGTVLTSSMLLCNYCVPGL